MVSMARNSSSLASVAAQLVLAFTLLCGWTLTATAADSTPQASDVVVAAIKGDVHVSTSGTERAVREGTVIELPASVRTGADSSIELRQGQTSVKVAADSQIDIPATAARGELLDRVLQPRGNAFYSVAKRTVKKLRVETPYLVAVIKGTQFNVAVQDETATISLYEGKLEIRATDESDVTDLNAGEIAIRHGGDKTIRVIRMDNGQPVPREHGNDRAAVPTTGSQDSGGTIPTRTPVDVAADNLPIGVTPIGPNGGANGSVATGVDLEVNAPFGRGNTAIKADANIGADISLAGPNAGVAAQVDAGVDVGPVGVDANVGTQVSVGAGGVAASLDASVGVAAGPATVDVGASTTVDVGPSGVGAALDTSVGVAAGPASVDVGSSTAVSVGSGGVDVGTSTTVSTPVADLGVGAAVSTTTPSVAVDTTVSTPVASIGIDTSVTPATPSVGVDTSLTTPVANLGVDLNLGGGPVVDISVTTPTPTAGSGTSGSTDTGGLLGRVGRLLGHN